MKHVLFATRKGGCGKSLICAETVLSLRRSGYKVQFLDLDQQGGSILESNEEPKADYVCVDTPGSLTEDLPNWIKGADVVCIPVLPSKVEMESLLLMIDAFRKHKKKGAKLIVVLNRFTRWTNSRDFIEWLSSVVNGRNEEITTLCQSELFEQAGARSESVVTFAPRSTAAASTLKMVNTIRKALGVEEERLLINNNN